MNSLNNDCNELKRQYDACFNLWFSERFLKGDYDDTVCSSIFKTYQECVKRAILEQNIEIREIEADYNLGNEYSNKSESSKS